MATTGGRTQASDQVFEDSDYYLSEEFVNRYANEVSSRSQTNSTQTTSIHDDDGDGDWFDTAGEGDPTDGNHTSILKNCTQNWKAASEDANKRSWSAFHETGLFACACRHGFIMWICDMIRSGEL